jgi:hypothetical protein
VNNQSSNMLIGRAVLVINVLDVNDNYPRFAENYSPRIREHTSSRKILEFKINDPDDQTNGKKKFQIKLGKLTNSFDEDNLKRDSFRNVARDFLIGAARHRRKSLTLRWQQMIEGLKDRMTSDVYKEMSE